MKKITSSFAFALISVSLSIGCPAPATDGGNAPIDEIDDDEMDEVESDADQVEEMDDPVECVYPDFTAQPQNAGDVMPPLVFEQKIYPEGETIKTSRPFRFEDFYCDDETYGGYESITFLMVAEWCNACPQEMQYATAMRHYIEGYNSLLVVFVAQNMQAAPGPLSTGNAFVSESMPDDLGMRSSGLNMTPANSLDMITNVFPAAWVINRSDMKIVAHQKDTNMFYLPYADILKDTSKDWTDFLSTYEPTPFAENCPAGEESSEPNNGPAEAGTLDFGTTAGGICASQDFDVYDIPMSGKISVELVHDFDQGDLALYETVVDGGQLGVRQLSQTLENEYLEMTGPTQITVTGGVLDASNSYELVVTSLE